MTALAAFWTFGGDEAAPRDCAAMLYAQAIYGRDARDTADLGAATLGRNLHRMLPEDRFDRQPVALCGGTAHLVADVRLDARDELAAAIGIPPDRLRHMADADVVAAAWERWGEDALPRIVGALALIVFNRAANSLTLARDVGGERPLFWHRDAGRAAATSMPAGLAALSGVAAPPDTDTLERMLGFRPPAPHRSHRAGMERVMPGEVVRITPAGVARRRFRAIAVRPDDAPRSFDDRVDAYREQLDRATAARLRGDGGVAAHLSGGWDSAAVTGTAARLLQPRGGRILALTSVPRAAAELADPSGRFVDETAHARAAAAMFANVDHLLVPGEARSPIADLDRWVALYDRPAQNLCNQVWLARIRDHARDRGVRVLLTGELGNYTISSAPAGLLADYIRRGAWRAWAREAAGALGTRRARLRGVLASSFSPWIPHALWRRLRRLSLRGSPDETLLLSAAGMARLQRARVEEHAADRPLDVAHATALALAEIDPGQQRKGVLAGWGIDERDPTGDIRVVEFMLSLPPDMFLRNGRRRPLARAALADRVPALILDEPRKGLQAADWFEGLSADRAALDALVGRIGAHPVAARLIDVPAMRALVDDWPSAGWDRAEADMRYRRALLNALSVGHFIVHG